MVGSRQVEIPFYRGNGRQRGRGFGALGQVIGELQFQFCVNISSQAAERVYANFLDLVAPDFAAFSAL